MRPNACRSSFESAGALALQGEYSGFAVAPAPISASLNASRHVPGGKSTTMEVRMAPFLRRPFAACAGIDRTDAGRGAGIRPAVRALALEWMRILDRCRRTQTPCNGTAVLR
jgi:hypothetical protein